MNMITKRAEEEANNAELVKENDLASRVAEAVIGTK